MNRELRHALYDRLFWPIVFPFLVLRLLAMWALFLLVLPFQWSSKMSFLSKLKNLHKSKTVIVNAAIAIAAAAPGVVEAVGPLLGENAVAKAVGAISVINVLLRLLTVKPIEHK